MVLNLIQHKRLWLVVVALLLLVGLLSAVPVAADNHVLQVPLYDRQGRTVGTAMLQEMDGAMTAMIMVSGLNPVFGSSAIATVEGGVCQPPTMPDDGTVLDVWGTLQRFGGTTIIGTVQGEVEGADHIVIYDDVDTDGEIVVCGRLPMMEGTSAPAPQPPAPPPAPGDDEGDDESDDTGDSEDSWMVEPFFIDLYDVNGRVVGEAYFEDTDEGTYIEMAVAGMNPVAGDHGVHIHEFGRCTPNFEAAGGHWNPDGSSHGFLVEDGPHRGDLLNMAFFSNGSSEQYAVISELFTLSDLFDSDGSAILIHAGPDDYKSQPSGNSGSPIVCGVIAPHQDDVADSGPAMDDDMGDDTGDDADDDMSDDDMGDDAGDDMGDDMGDDVGDDTSDDDMGDDTGDDTGDDMGDDTGDDMGDDAGDDVITDRDPVAVTLYDRQGRAVGSATVSLTGGVVAASVQASGFNPVNGSSAIAILEGGVCSPPNSVVEGEPVSWLGDLQRFAGTTIDGTVSGESEWGDVIAIYADVSDNPGEIIACGSLPQ